MSLTEKQRAEAVRRANDVYRFPALCRITRLDGSIGGIVATPTQRILQDLFVETNWTYVVKYRQAMSSIIHIADQLRYVMYNPGQMGMTIGDKEATYKELMRRQGVMYNGLHEAVQVPLERPPSSEEIRFSEPHNGLIQGITGGGENPAIGFSPDYGVVSEYGLYQNYLQFDPAFFPAIARRPNARCRVETTPGTYNSPGHEMFREGLAGRGRFPVGSIFLAWWRDEACTVPPPPGFEPTPEEREYRKKILYFEQDARGKRWWRYPENPRSEGISDGHLAFRRVALETEFHGDPRLFDNKHPPSPFEGWLVSANPTIPAEPVARMLRTAQPTEFGEEAFYDTETREKITIEEWRLRNPGVPVLITVDGKGYGKAGDPSAMTAWNMWDWKEAGSWEGDEDPGELVGTKEHPRRLLRWQRILDADVIIETNKDGVAAAAQAADCPKLFWSDSGQPGWYSTEASKNAALIGLVNLLRQGEVEIVSAATLNQLATWDGKTRAQESGRRKHHWDRAITCLIFAYGVQVLGHQRRPRKPTQEELEERQRLTLARFLAAFESEDKGKGRILGRV